MKYEIQSEAHVSRPSNTETGAFNVLQGMATEQREVSQDKC